jgi:hypothetical protein
MLEVVTVPFSWLISSSASGEGARTGSCARGAGLSGFAVVVGLSWKAASMRLKKGATEGFAGRLLASTPATGERRVTFLAGVLRRSRRDWTDVSLDFDLCLFGEEEEARTSVLLVFVGLGEGRRPERCCFGDPLRLRARVVRSLSVHGSVACLSIDDRMIRQNECIGCKR